MKYDVNKQRAQFYASEYNKSITYSQAKDTASAEAVREKPNLSQEKLEWLQRHDRESCDLYGMLPLVRGMPVALTDHIDRSREKNLLRGRRGYIHSWVLESDEAKKSEFVQDRRVLQKFPKVVFLSLIHI